MRGIALSIMTFVVVYMMAHSGANLSERDAGFLAGLLLLTFGVIALGL